MDKKIYVCPVTGGELKLVDDGVSAQYFQNSAGMKFAFKEAFPDFTYPIVLSERQQEQHQYYENNAAVYDDIQGLTFALQGENEQVVRQKMVSYLDLSPDSKVLELSCGTGRDSENIAALLNQHGELYVQDLSAAMLQQCQAKLQRYSVPINYSIGNASYLAFPDNYFDAVYSFGGLNVYEDPARSLQEMARVAKPGGRIVVGDESLPVWLYETEFGKILLNGNPLFKFKVPFEAIPVQARDVTVRWVIGGVYYLISFIVADGPPQGNFDIEIPGRRGGTLNTRYYGKLEGVTEETKRLVMKAAESNKTSIHKWIDKTLRDAANVEFSSTPAQKEKDYV